MSERIRLKYVPKSYLQLVGQTVEGFDLKNVSGTDIAFPVLQVPAVSGPVRSDNTFQIMGEAENFSGLEANKGVISGLVVPASGHTNLQIPDVQEFRSIVSRITNGKAEIPFSPDNLVAQLLVFVFGEEAYNLKRFDLLSLSELKPGQRNPFLEATSKRISQAVEILQQTMNIEDATASKNLKIYATFGHALPEERASTGLTRGAQSQQELHFNVTAFPSNISAKTVTRDISLDTLIKQVDVNSTVFWDLFSPQVENRIRTFLQEQGLGKRVDVKANKSHSASDDYITFHEGYSLRFTDMHDKPGQPLEDALNIALDVIGDFNKFYEGLRLCYDRFQINHGRKKVANSIFEEAVTMAEARGFERKEAEKLVNIIFSISPTYMQIKQYMSSDREEKPNKLGRKRLTLLREKYDRLRKKYFGVIPSNQKSEVFMRDGVKLNKFLGRGSLGGAFALRMIEDQIADFDAVDDPSILLKRTENTFPVHFSGSILITKWHLDEDRRIIVDELSIAARFNHKGVVEDLIGAALERTAGI